MLNEFEYARIALGDIESALERVLQRLFHKGRATLTYTHAYGCPRIYNTRLGLFWKEGWNSLVIEKNYVLK